MKLEKSWPEFFSRLPKCSPFQSCPFLSIDALLWPCCVSFMLCSTLLRCFILLLLMFRTSWIYPAGSKHQLDRILINSKWVNSLRNGRAYNTVELDSDHRIVTILLVTSSRASKVNPCKRPRFN